MFNYPNNLINRTSSAPVSSDNRHSTTFHISEVWVRTAPSPISSGKSFASIQCRR